MVEEFSFGNFWSFKGIQTLNLAAAKIKSKNTELDDINVFPINSDLSLLKSKAIYGANASGKSKFIDALKFMVRFAITSSSDGQVIKSIDVEPFKLQIESEKDTSEFEVIFTHNNARRSHYLGVDMLILKSPHGKT